MTKQKKLKVLIRERMKKTGERYAAARRQVLQNASPQINDPDICHIPGNIPATTALRILLESKTPLPRIKGHAMDEAMLFGIAGGIGMGVFTFHYESANFSSLFLAGRHAWEDDAFYLTNALERMGIRPIIRETGGIKTAAKHLMEMLDNYGPVIAWIDAGSLPYRSLPQMWEGSGYHVVVVHKIDVAKQQAIVSDLTNEYIELPLDVLSKARARIKKFKNRLLAIETGFSFQNNADKLIRSGIAACCERLANPRTISFGLKALPLFAKRMRGDGTKDSWDRIFPRGQHLWNALTWIYDWIEHYGTGGGLCRPVFSQFLITSAEILQNKNLLETARLYETIGQKWSDIADAALPSHIPMFGEAKRLLAEKTEVFLNDGVHASENVAQIWKKLSAFSEQATRDFPLSDEAALNLRASLADRIDDVYQLETEALERLTIF